MAALPSPTQVAGIHTAIYEAYFNQLEKHGSVAAVDAAKFLKKSELPDKILSKIWDLSDPNAKGYLNKVGFFVAMKLVSLAQMGHETSIGNLTMDVPPPKMGSQPHTMETLSNIPTINSVPATISDWAMKPSERANYEQLFDSLQPLNGVIPGNKVKGLLIDSKLPVNTLRKIWDLADMDKDGNLDRHEFIVAMHLVYKALEKYAIPSSLPPELLPPGKRKESIQTNHLSYNGSAVTWVVTPEEKAQYDTLFQNTDIDKDGFVSGPEIKDIFLRSGVPQSTLASIWGLCDVKQSGLLNSEQFALAMWFIKQKLKGIDPPSVLTPEMVPPSFRSKAIINENNNTPYTSNPEIDMIVKDIEELMREKQCLENEIIQKEADIKIKTGEAKSLQGELDTLAATLKQLENQKGEAQKRLNDLKNQSLLMEKELSEVKLVLELEHEQVDKLKKQAEEQVILVKAQEEELSNKKQELEDLKTEESKLEAQQNQLLETLNNISTTLQDSQLNISQIKTKITQVQDHQRQLKDAITIIDAALAGGDLHTISQTYLEIEPEFQDPKYTRLISKQTEEPEVKMDVFKPKSENIPNDSFSQSTFNNDPFASNDHFASAFQPSNNTGFGNDPFSSFGTSSVKADPFDPFGSSSGSAPKPVDDGSQDPFGCEPFGTAAPALPPKNKQPPPRPAPPRPAPPPSMSQGAPASDAFADFSNFNAKFDSQISNLEFTEDPFRDYYQNFGEDLFSSTDPFEDNSNHVVLSEEVNRSEGDAFTPTNKVATNLIGKFKSDEQLIDCLKKNHLDSDLDKFNSKEKFSKCDSLPSLLS